MPLAPRFPSTFARAIVSVAVLLAAMLFVVVRPMAAAQEAPTAPEPDDAAVRRVVDTDHVDRPIEVVELVAGGDVSDSRHHGLLAREIARQAVLLSAREQFGLRTRDRMLRESGGDESTPGRLLLDVTICFKDRGEVAIEVARVDGEKRQSLVRSTKRFGDGKTVDRGTVNTGTVDYAALAAWCEDLSRGEIAAALRTAMGLADESATGAKSTSAGGDDDLPEDVARRMRRMTFASQYAAVRRLHELALRDGPDSSASAALARGYANLGVLSDMYWHSAGAAFKARSLLYAQRAVAAESGDSLAGYRNRRSFGYSLALCGLHRAAATTLATVRPPATAATPSWTVVAEALCEFDGARLAAIPIDSDTGEIARVCKVLMAEHSSVMPEDMDYEAYSASEKLLTAAALELPHCWRVRAAAGRRVFDVGGRATFDAQWYRDVAGTPRIALAVGEIAERQAAADVDVDVAIEQKSRAELVKSLRAAAREDEHEPSLSVLATLVEEASFVDAFEYAQVMVGGYDRDETKQAVAEFRNNVVPIVERHPLHPMLDEWLKMATGSSIDFDVDRMLRAIDDSVTTTATFDLLDLGYREPGYGVAGKLHKAIVAHADETFADIALLASRYDVDDKARYAEKLYDVSPHAPQAVAGMVRYHWPRVAEKAEEWERRYAGEPGVMAMLGSRYLAEKRTADARRCFQAYLKLTTSRAWVSLWAYRHLAETYRIEGDTRQWLATLEEFLREEGAADQRGDVQVLIARHYLAQGDYAQALHYAESVDSYDETEAQVVVAECREYQHRWLAAEQAYRSVAEDDPYSPQVLLWHRYCAQSGYGSMTTARNVVLGYVESLDEEDDGAVTEPDALAGIGYFYLLENEGATAAKWLARAVEAGRERNADDVADPRHALQLVLVAHQLGKHEQRDTALDRVVRSGEKFVASGQPRRELVAFAVLLQKSFATDADATKSATSFERAAADELIASATGEDRALLCYLVGQVLEANGLRAEAQEYLRRAVATPAREASRSLAAVLLRRAGVEPNEIVVGSARRDSRATGG